MKKLQHQPSQSLAKIQALTAMATFGTIGLFAKQIPLASVEIAAYRAVIAFVFLLGLIFLRKKTSGFSQIRAKIIPLLASGLAIGINWILLFEAFRYTSIAIATLSYYFAPTLVILASILFFGEGLGLRQLIGFAGSTCGLVLVMNIGAGGPGNSMGIFYGLGAAIFYAAILLLNKTMGEIDAIVRSCIQFGVASLALLPYVGFTSGFHFTTLTGAQTANILVVGVVHTGIMYWLCFSALSVLRGQQVAILSYVDPLVAVLLSVLWFREPITYLQLAGGAMILAFTLFSELGERASAPVSAVREKTESSDR
jgi:RarD protein